MRGGGAGCGGLGLAITLATMLMSLTAGAHALWQTYEYLQQAIRVMEDAAELYH